MTTDSKSGNIRKPEFEVPPMACDTHLHVFGKPGKYPYGSELRYKPPFTPIEDYLVLANRLNLERMVFTQPSAYGTNNSYMLEVMAELGDKCRGIITVEENVTDTELQTANDVGVRGFRINVSPYKPYDPGFTDQIVSRVERLGQRAKRFGWHLQFLSPGWLVHELIPTLQELPVPFVIDHMGLFPAKDGVEQPGFQKLLHVVRGGQCWVKLTGAYRFSSDFPEFKDVTPFAQALIEAGPERILWGSDYPHLSFDDKVDSLSLFNLLKVWVPDEAQRKKILVDNPISLFGFSKA